MRANGHIADESFSKWRVEAEPRARGRQGASGIMMGTA
jgi:hypothetical protein